MVLLSELAEVTVEIFVEDAQAQDGKPRFRFPPRDGEVIDMPEVRPTTHVHHCVDHPIMPIKPLNM